jgi:hypothetical protein
MATCSRGENQQVLLIATPLLAYRSVTKKYGEPVGGSLWLQLLEREMPAGSGW